MEKLNSFNKDEVKESLNVWIEKTKSGEPALTNGETWLMTWDRRDLNGFQNIEKDDVSWDLYYEGVNMFWMVESEFDKMFKRILKYKENYSLSLDSTNLESIEEFVDFYVGMESVFKTFIVPIISSITLSAVELKIVKAEKVIEFHESAIVREYFIKLVEYVISGVKSHNNYSFPYIIASIMNKHFDDKRDYRDFLLPLESSLYLK